MFPKGQMVSVPRNLSLESVDAAYRVEPLVVEPETPVCDVFALLKVQNAGSVLICRDGLLVGIFTERDALKLIAAGADLSSAIESVMVPNPTTLAANCSVGAAIEKMATGGYRRLPIVDDDKRPTGMVKVTGIIHYLVEHFPEKVYNLPPEPRPMTQEREGA